MGEKGLKIGQHTEINTQKTKKTININNKTKKAKKT